MKRLSIGTAIVAVLALSSVALAAGPSGTYKRNVRTKALNGVLNGTWTVTLYRGRYTVTDKGAIVLQGQYSIHGNRITIGGGSGQAFCKVTGIYSFKLSGGKLSFGRVNDPTKKCQARVDVLTNGPFTKVG